MAPVVRKQPVNLRGVECEHDSAAVDMQNEWKGGSGLHIFESVRSCKGS